VSAYAREQLAVGLGNEPAAESGVENDVARVIGDRNADDRRVAAEWMRAQRAQHGVGGVG
jgi:hypothetical protein